MSLQGTNEFLSTISKFLEVFRDSIDYYETRKSIYIIEDQEVGGSVSETFMLLVSIIVNIISIGITATFSIIAFTINTFITPYISDVVYFTTMILAFITAIILSYYLLVKFNQVNNFVSKEYIEFFIESFQKLCKGV